MNNKGFDTRLIKCSDKITDKTIVFDLINTDTVLDRHINIHSIEHRFTAIGHQYGLSHQTGTKGASLHAFTRAAAIEIDFIVAPVLSDFRACRQILRIAAAQLQSHGMLFFIEVKMTRFVAVDDRACRYHFRIEPRMMRELTMEIATVPIRPVQHRCHTEAPRIVLSHDFEKGHSHLATGVARQ